MAHLTITDRLYIEKLLLKRRYSIAEIADIVGVSSRTIYYEIRRATYKHLLPDYTYEERYVPEEAHRKYRENLKKKGVKPKILQDKKLIQYIGRMIIEYKYSPKAILHEINKNESLNFDVQIKSVNTIYKAIRDGNIEGVTMEDLPRKGRLKKKRKKVRPIKSVPKGESIEKRAEHIDDRLEFGHWEMDTVKGVRETGKCLLVLTERSTRFEFIQLMKRCNTDEVRKALNRIARTFGSLYYSIFKTITVDNGSEFRNFDEMKKALYRVGDRSKISYCHPYAPHERGSNENANILIRCWLPKGKSMDNVSKKDVEQLQYWINNYPRSIFNGASSGELIQKVCPFFPAGYLQTYGVLGLLY